MAASPSRALGAVATALLLLAVFCDAAPQELRAPHYYYSSPAGSTYDPPFTSHTSGSVASYQAGGGATAASRSDFNAGTSSTAGANDRPSASNFGLFSSAASSSNGPVGAEPSNLMGYAAPAQFAYSGSSREEAVDALEHTLANAQRLYSSFASFTRPRAPAGRRRLEGVRLTKRGRQLQTELPQQEESDEDKLQPEEKLEEELEETKLASEEVELSGAAAGPRVRFENPPSVSSGLASPAPSFETMLAETAQLARRSQSLLQRMARQDLRPSPSAFAVVSEAPRMYPGAPPAYYPPVSMAAYGPSDFFVPWAPYYSWYQPAVARASGAVQGNAAAVGPPPAQPNAVAAPFAGAAPVASPPMGGARWTDGQDIEESLRVAQAMVVEAAELMRRVGEASAAHAMNMANIARERSQRHEDAAHDHQQPEETHQEETQQQPQAAVRRLGRFLEGASFEDSTAVAPAARRLQRTGYGQPYFGLGSFSQWGGGRYGRASSPSSPSFQLASDDVLYGRRPTTIRRPRNEAENDVYPPGSPTPLGQRAGHLPPGPPSALPPFHSLASNAAVSIAESMGGPAISESLAQYAPALSSSRAYGNGPAISSAWTRGANATSNAQSARGDAVSTAEAQEEGEAMSESAVEEEGNAISASYTDRGDAMSAAFGGWRGDAFSSAIARRIGNAAALSTAQQGLATADSQTAVGDSISTATTLDEGSSVSSAQATDRGVAISSATSAARFGGAAISTAGTNDGDAISSAMHTTGGATAGTEARRSAAVSSALSQTRGNAISHSRLSREPWVPESSEDYELADRVAAEQSDNFNGMPIGELGSATMQELNRDVGPNVDAALSTAEATHGDAVSLAEAYEGASAFSVARTQQGAAISRAVSGDVDRDFY
eukprot:GHVT01016847.1.p1 GENE.GHVT01016847.1~~GHVT01016847.1.p1  ORF type:complete len:891 (-),score=213.03 GHVT01016847.1:644-3316(-)